MIFSKDWPYCGYAVVPVPKWIGWKYRDVRFSQPMVIIPRNADLEQVWRDLGLTFYSEKA
jgi:hypothetical protein